MVDRFINRQTTIFNANTYARTIKIKDRVELLPASQNTGP